MKNMSMGKILALFAVMVVVLIVGTVWYMKSAAQAENNIPEKADEVELTYGEAEATNTKADEWEELTKDAVVDRSQIPEDINRNLELMSKNMEVLVQNISVLEKRISDLERIDRESDIARIKYQSYLNSKEATRKSYKYTSKHKGNRVGHNKVPSEMLDQKTMAVVSGRAWVTDGTGMEQNISVGETIDGKKVKSVSKKGDVVITTSPK